MSKRAEWAERYVQRAERKAAEPDARRPLTASQHILHLLLTLVTLGLWAPVWIVRAIQGNRPYVPPEEPVSTSAEPAASPGERMAQAFAVAYESWVKEPPEARGPEPRYEDFRAAGQRDAQGQP
jgi:hypothetical protein